MRHEVEDWEPAGTLLYRCRRCGVEIPSAVILCPPAEEAELRVVLPDRLVFAIPGAAREFADARNYAAFTGLPSCTMREIGS